MAWRLDLRGTFDRPADLPQTEWRCFGSRDRGLVGLPRSARELELLELVNGALQTRRRYHLPPSNDRRELALHPDGVQLAAAVEDGVHLLQPEGGDQLVLETAALGGIPRALLFDPRGELLWLTYEADDGTSHAAVLDGATMDILARLRLGGLGRSFHSLEPHPTLAVVSVEVARGQEGTWLSFLEFRDRTFRALASIERPGALISMAGFAPSGRWLAALAQGRLQILSWPDLGELTAVAPPLPRTMFDWLATYVGERFVGSLFAPEQKEYHLAVFSPELEPEGLLHWERGDQEYLFDLVGLPGDHLLVFGDRRAGLFKLQRAA